MPLYIRHLPGACSRLIETSSLPKNAVCFNPSRAGQYIYIRMTMHDAVCETNHILIYNTETSKLHQVAYDMSMLEPTVNLFQGLEDLRICVFEGRLWFTATTTHASAAMNNEMVLGRICADLSKVECIQVLDFGVRPIKNICPFVKELNGVKTLHLLDLYKSTIYCVREEEGSVQPSWHMERVQNLEWHADAGGASCPDLGNATYRGSTSPIHLHGNVWGCIGHDIIFNDNTKLVTRLSYLHHWIEMDLARGAVTFISSPFWVAHWGVEYVSGLHADADGSKITLYLGVNDKDAASCDTTLADLRCGK